MCEILLTTVDSEFFWGGGIYITHGELKCLVLTKTMENTCS